MQIKVGRAVIGWQVVAGLLAHNMDVLSVELCCFLNMNSAFAITHNNKVTIRILGSFKNLIDDLD
ncbi:hypothetical protein BA900_03145 [Spiribacter roseus]|nr:hypothetical protein BA900_03145 [Spiribacter roseus]